MQKVPVYIGVFVQDNKIASKQIRNALMSGMQEILQNHPQDELTEQIISDMSNFQQTFIHPADNYHITSLFIGGNTKKLNPQQLKQYNNFKPHQKAIIKIDCIIYVPGYIVCGYCSDTDGIEVDNRYAHVTLYLGNGAKAVQSNSVIESLAQKNKELFNKKQFKTGKYSMDYNKHQWAFIIGNGIQLKGVTGTNFTHGKR